LFFGTAVFVFNQFLSFSIIAATGIKNFKKQLTKMFAQI